jgi:hypothetical protein
LLAGRGAIDWRLVLAMVYAGFKGEPKSKRAYMRWVALRPQRLEAALASHAVNSSRDQSAR